MKTFYKNTNNGKEILEVLKSQGGRNINNWCCGSNTNYYTVDEFGIIQSYTEDEIKFIKENHEICIITLVTYVTSEFYTDIDGNIYIMESQTSALCMLDTNDVIRRHVNVTVPLTKSSTQEILRFKDILRERSIYVNYKRLTMINLSRGRTYTFNGTPFIFQGIHKNNIISYIGTIDGKLELDVKFPIKDDSIIELAEGELLNNFNKYVESRDIYFNKNTFKVQDIIKWTAEEDKTPVIVWTGYKWRLSIFIRFNDSHFSTIYGDYEFVIPYTEYTKDYINTSIQPKSHYVFTK